MINFLQPFIGNLEQCNKHLDENKNIFCDCFNIIGSCSDGKALVALYPFQIMDSWDNRTEEVRINVYTGDIKEYMRKLSEQNILCSCIQKVSNVNDTYVLMIHKK